MLIGLCSMIFTEVPDAKSSGKSQTWRRCSSVIGSVDLDIIKKRATGAFFLVIYDNGLRRGREFALPNHFSRPGSTGILTDYYGSADSDVTYAITRALQQFLLQFSQLDSIITSCALRIIRLYKMW